MIAVIWCRLFALWMLASGLEDSAHVVGIIAVRLFRMGSYRFYDEMIGELLPVALPAIVWLAMAWFFWRRAPALASRLAEGADSAISHQGINPSELLNIVIIGVGLYLLTTGIPIVSQLIYLAVENARVGAGFPLSQISTNIFSSIIRCILGFWLILGSRGVARLIQTHSGRWKDPSAHPEPSSPDKVD